jgi:hypothetical protein
LLKSGYGENLDSIRRMTAREALQAIHYEGFLDDYQLAVMEMNKEP